ncbi:hypothetical protein Golomagni_01788 [Golovinomyces magnicellulatus]|nr:hypothetical protein Golomagni_01788 [Golovinomyces magnicellulatus]
MAEQDWKILEKKWNIGVDVASASTEDLTSYINTKIHFYEEDNTTNANLWEQYQDDFQAFTVTNFNQSKLKYIQRLRDCLLSRGVFVAKNNNRLTISQALYSCAHEDEQHQWTDDDLINAAERLDEPLKSRKLRQRLDILQNITKHSEELAPSRNKLKPDICATEPRTSFTPLNQTSTTSLQPLSAVRLKSQISHLYTNQIANLIKAYANEPKYEGNGDSIDHKLSCFYHLCELTGVPEEAYPKVLSVMLTGFAKEHYLAANLSQLTFHTAIDHLRPGYNRRNLGKWNVTNLKSIISQNSNKTTLECLQFLVHTLREIQHGLSEDLRTNSFLHDKLITACQGVPACRYAIANPPTKIGELLNNLQNSITAYEEEENST